MKIKFILLLAIISNFISCKNSNNTPKVVQTITKKEVLEKTFDTISTCQLSNKTEVTLLKSKENVKQIYINVKNKYLNIDTGFNLDSLNIIFYKISDVELKCRDSSFIITYTDHFANDYSFNHHVFTYDKNTKNYVFNKVFITTSSRWDIDLSGKLIRNYKSFAKYDGNEPEDNETKSIYYYYGIQEEKPPIASIDKYYESIKELTSTNSKDIQVFGDKFVLDYILNEVAITPKNLYQYNDIAYYLEQSGLYENAIYLLEKIIKKFPNRTVAYLNLGDAYWKLHKEKKAEKAYREYIRQIKKSNKGNKIPKKIFDRLKSLK